MKACACHCRKHLDQQVPLLMSRLVDKAGALYSSCESQRSTYLVASGKAQGPQSRCKLRDHLLELPARK